MRLLHKPRISSNAPRSTSSASLSNWLRPASMFALAICELVPYSSPSPLSIHWYHCDSGSYIGAYLPIYMGRHRLYRPCNHKKYPRLTPKDDGSSRKRGCQFTLPPSRCILVPLPTSLPNIRSYNHILGSERGSD